MTDLDACVPQRIPERTRHGLDGGYGLLAFEVVDEEQIKVAPGSELAASEPANSEQCKPTLCRRVRTDRCREHRTNPVVSDDSE